MRKLRFRKSIKKKKNLPQTAICKWKSQDSSPGPLVTKVKLLPAGVHTSILIQNREQFKNKSNNKFYSKSAFLQEQYLA